MAVTSPEIVLTKAIQKAFSKGWNGCLDDEGYTDLTDDWEVVGHYNFPGMHVSTDSGDIAPEQILFNHGFAKALWGEDVLEYVTDDKTYHFDNIPVWEFHLQQMVIAEDPIKYLAANI